MELPTVVSPIRDAECDVLYEVVAYRKLTRDEVVAAVRAYRATKGRKNPKRGSVVRIVTVLGFEGS